MNSAVTSIQGNLQYFLDNSVGYLLTTAQKTAWRTFNTSLRNDASLNDASITTYTYKPLVGITSETSPNGVTTYYEYDGFGRLAAIRNDDGNLLKKFTYNYAND